MLSFNLHKPVISALFLGLLALLLSSLACKTLTAGLPVPTSYVYPTTAPDLFNFTTQQPQGFATAPVLPQMSEAPVSGTNYEGVSFSFAPEIARNITPQTIPAYNPPQDAAPGDTAAPQFIRFNFSGYPLSGTNFEPTIDVFPVMAYEDINPDVIGKIENLRKFLADKPTAYENLPFLPMFNAGQMMKAGVAYLDFKNGSGVRYLTQYGQAFLPINNKAIFYTFQGITKDDMYYVSAIFPVSHPSLPADDTLASFGDPQAFSDNFPQYVLGVETNLDSQNPSSFTPSLVLLDELFQSLEIVK